MKTVILYVHLIFGLDPLELTQLSFNSLRTHNVIEEKSETSGKRLDSLELELRQREKEVDDANHQRTALQKDIHSLKQTAKGKYGVGESLGGVKGQE